MRRVKDLKVGEWSYVSSYMPGEEEFLIKAEDAEGRSPLIIKTTDFNFTIDLSKPLPKMPCLIQRDQIRCLYVSKNKSTSSLKDQLKDIKKQIKALYAKRKELAKKRIEEIEYQIRETRTNQAEYDWAKHYTLIDEARRLENKYF